MKLKFADFTRTTAQRATGAIDDELFAELLREAWERGGGKAVRLIGAGVRFVCADDPEDADAAGQLEMF